jgi:hypothetical protein
MLGQVLPGLGKLVQVRTAYDRLVSLKQVMEYLARLGMCRRG